MNKEITGIVIAIISLALLFLIAYLLSLPFRKRYNIPMNIIYKRLKRIVGFNPSIDRSMANLRDKLWYEVRYYKNCTYWRNGMVNVLRCKETPPPTRLMKLLRLWVILKKAKKNNNSFYSNPYLKALFNETIVQLGKEINPKIPVSDLIKLTRKERRLLKVDPVKIY